MFKISPTTREVSFSLNKKIYPTEAITAAAHIFASRAQAYVEDGKTYRKITLEVSKKFSSKDLQALAGNFLNEILNQILCQRLLSQNTNINSYVVTQALLAARRDDANPAQPLAAMNDQMTQEQRKEAEALYRETQEEIKRMKERR